MASVRSRSKYRICASGPLFKAIILKGLNAPSFGYLRHRSITLQPMIAVHIVPYVKKLLLPKNEIFYGKKINSVTQVNGLWNFVGNVVSFQRWTKFYAELFENSIWSKLISRKKHFLDPQTDTNPTKKILATRNPNLIRCISIRNWLTLNNSILKWKFISLVQFGLLVDLEIESLGSGLV